MVNIESYRHLVRHRFGCRTTRCRTAVRASVWSTRGSSTRFASHWHKHHAAAVDATSPAPDCLAERRQFTATVLRVSFGSCYRHVAASLLLRWLALPRMCSDCVIV
ncbi:hypothetical protein [Paraburkholderia sp. WP4_3_2]|uniref:hypothetical protein n=1 Tax=Paraburkholderia sp. WP4_3_2 TaxID=2587162 RepID=UPI00161820DA|nr:hypothetical protein [Paraburkholderia sp. WP4_3_2]